MYCGFYSFLDGFSVKNKIKSFVFLLKKVGIKFVFLFVVV